MKKFELDNLMLLELDVRSDDITDEDRYRLLSRLRYKAWRYDNEALDLEIELRPKDSIYWSPEQEREYCRSMVGCRGCPVYDWHSDDCMLTKQKPVKLRPKDWTDEICASRRNPE